MGIAMINKVLEKLDELERQVQEIRLEVVAMYIPDNEELTLNQQSLIYSLRNWQDERHLPHTSADEVDQTKLTRSERDWLWGWVDRWDASQSPPSDPYAQLVYNTGGGNTAYRLDLPPGGYVLITNGDLSHKVTDHIEIGVYNNADECLVFKEFKLV